MTDDEGNEISSIDYYPYGDCRKSQPEIDNFPTDKLFTSQRYDDTGLYYYGARYYDPSIGRFISPDTIIPDPMNPQAFNRYSYCLNNPLKYVDPSGHVVTINDIDIYYLNYLMYHPELLLMVSSSSVLVESIVEYIDVKPVYHDFRYSNERETAERMEKSIHSYDVSLVTEEPTRLCFETKYSTTYYKYREHATWYPFREGDKREGAWDKDWGYGEEPIADVTPIIGALELGIGIPVTIIGGLLATVEFMRGGLPQSGYEWMYIGLVVTQQGWNDMVGPEHAIDITGWLPAFP